MKYHGYKDGTKECGTKHLVFSTIFPKDLQFSMYGGKKELLNQMDSDRMKYIPLFYAPFDEISKQVTKSGKYSDFFVTI